MLKNYIKTAWRNLWKGRVFNGMNVLGLAIAIASSTLLLLTVYFEFSYDKFNKNLDNIYQVYFTASRPDGAEKSGAMPLPLTPTLKAEYPEIRYITRANGGNATVTYGDKQLNKSVLFADADLFKIFTYPIISGDSKGIPRLNDVVITQPAAKSIFGNADPIGKTITLTYGNQPHTFIVSAIMADFPGNSSMAGDIVLRFENTPGYQENLNEWYNRSHSVYVQLNDNVNAAVLENKLKAFEEKHLKKDLDDLKRDGAKLLPNGQRESINLTPYGNTHFNTEISGVDGSPISKTYVIALLIIALFILIIASINFVNLSVARSFTRAREVGVRKTLGAGKWQLLTQFWVETILICLIALLIGLALATAILPGFKATFKSNISIALLWQPLQLASAVVMFILITVVAGFYPALLMMRYKTVQVLKGSVSTNKPGKVRNILLVVQFSLATLLTICTLVTWQQIKYIQNKPLGFNKTEVLSIPVGSSLQGNQALQLFRNQMQGQAGVVSISGAYNNMGRGKDGSSFTSVVTYEYKGHNLRSHLQKVDFDYLKTLDIKLLEGRDFSRDFASDTNNLVINEKMAAEINGGKNVLGTYLPMFDGQPPMQVIGIVKDYNFRSLHEDVQPISLTMDKGFPINYIFVRLKPNSLSQSYNLVKEKWHATFPNVEFNGTWLNENTEKQYRNEKRLSTIYVSAAIIAIVISCIGLLAMSVMVIMQRTKEIGIRKVLGASVTSIVMLISKEFVKLVLLASVIAFPVAWWFMHQWLQGFAYRINIQWWIFALATGIALIIALLTISVQAIRAALSNPVRSLKSE